MTDRGSLYGVPGVGNLGLLLARCQPSPADHAAVLSDALLRLVDDPLHMTEPTRPNGQPLHLRHDASESVILEVPSYPSLPQPNRVLLRFALNDAATFSDRSELPKLVVASDVAPASPD